MPTRREAWIEGDATSNAFGARPGHPTCARRTLPQSPEHRKCAETVTQVQKLTHAHRRDAKHDRGVAYGLCRARSIRPELALRYRLGCRLRGRRDRDRARADRRLRLRPRVAAPAPTTPPTDTPRRRERGALPSPCARNGARAAGLPAGAARRGRAGAGPRVRARPATARHDLGAAGRMPG